MGTMDTTITALSEGARFAFGSEWSADNINAYGFTVVSATMQANGKMDINAFTNDTGNQKNWKLAPTTSVTILLGE